MLEMGQVTNIGNFFGTIHFPGEVKAIKTFLAQDFGPLFNLQGDAVDAGDASGNKSYISQVKISGGKIEISAHKYPSSGEN